jgi:hypothetical protein
MPDVSRMTDQLLRSVAMEPITLPIRQASAVSGLSAPTIYREAGRGKIKLLKYGRTTLVCMSSLRTFLDGLPRASIRAPRTGS